MLWLLRYWLMMTLVYKIFLKNALYLVFDWFPLILGRWFRIRSLFSDVWSEFCTVASFVFFSVENLHFELFSKCIIFKNLLFFNMKREYNFQQFAKRLMEIGPMVRKILYLKAKNISKFRDFFKNFFFTFPVKSSFGLKKLKKKHYYVCSFSLWGRKIHTAFSLTTRFRMLADFVKTGSSVNGLKNLIFQKSGVNIPLWYIKLFVSYNWPKLTH